MNGRERAPERDIDRAVRAWLSDVPSLPAHAVDEVIAGLGQTSQRYRSGLAHFFASGRAQLACAVMMVAAVVVALVAVWRLGPLARSSDQVGAAPSIVVTEAAEPGVLRVLRDDAGHDLTATYPDHPRDLDRITVGPDGSVWVASTAHGSDNEQVSGSLVWRLGEPGWQSVVDGVPGTVSDMAVGPDGVVWVAGDDGLASFDGQQWTDAGRPGGVRLVQPAADGSVWAVGEGRARRVEIGRLTAGQWVDHTDDRVLGPLLRSNAVTSIAATPDGSVWVGLDADVGPGAGLIRHDGTDWEIVRPLGGLGEEASHDVFALGVGADGALWAFLDSPFYRTATDFRLARYDGDAWTAHSYADGVPPDADPWASIYRRLAVGADGAVWLPGGAGGLVTFDGRDTERYLAGTMLNGAGVGPDGLVWTVGGIGRDSSGGLYLIQP